MTQTLKAEGVHDWPWGFLQQGRREGDRRGETQHGDTGWKRRLGAYGFYLPLRLIWGLGRWCYVEAKSPMAWVPGAPGDNTFLVVQQRQGPSRAAPWSCPGF